MKAPIVLAGASGYIGSFLAQHFAEAGHDVLALCRSGQGFHHDKVLWLQADLLAPDQLALIPVQPDSVFINAAGYPSPDLCEQNPHESYQQNVVATRHFLDWAQARKAAQVLHLSTDLIFGEGGPFGEEDLAKSITHYGGHKLLAEELFPGLSLPYTIIRPVMLYGPKSPSGREGFVQMVERRLTAGDRLRMANDQVRNPTFILDLCRFVATCIHRELTGVYNLGGPEFVTIYQFAQAIAEAAHLPNQLIEAIESHKLPAGAPRALKTGVIVDKAKENGFTATPLMQGLQRSVEYSVAK